MNRRKSAFRWSMALAILAFISIYVTAARASTFKVLWDWTGYVGTEGHPNGGLVFDSQGNLYGTNLVFGCDQQGGVANVFQLTPNADGTWSQAPIYCFDGTNSGFYPLDGVVFDRLGNLYTTASQFGNGGQGQGTVLELMPNPDGTWTEVTLYVFSGGWDGANPGVAPVPDNAGNVYGTTPKGGVHGQGVVYRLRIAPVPVLTVLHAFTGDTDGSPSGRVTLDAKGNIYGMTSSGGAYGMGTVFKLTPNKLSFGWTETVIYEFTGGAAGGFPNGGLVFDGVGNLYGVTTSGGVSGSSYCPKDGCGTVFELTPNPDGSWSESVIYDFQGFDRNHNYTDFDPLGPLAFDSTGNLYGVTSVVFKLTPSSGGRWTETILGGPDHCEVGPIAPDLLLDSADNVYGSNADANVGCVWEIIP